MRAGGVVVHHQLKTAIPLVGMQVWRGALLCADYLVHKAGAPPSVGTAGLPAEIDAQIRHAPAEMIGQLRLGLVTLTCGVAADAYARSSTATRLTVTIWLCAADKFRDTVVLELGAGTGLAGLVCDLVAQPRAVFRTGA